MNDELIKRIDERVDFWKEGEPSTSPIVQLLRDCRAALSRKYVPMTEREKHEITTEWMSTNTSESLTTWVENEVIRRAGLEVSK